GHAVLHNLDDQPVLLPGHQLDRRYPEVIGPVEVPVVPGTVEVGADRKDDVHDVGAVGGRDEWTRLRTIATPPRGLTATTRRGIVGRREVVGSGGRVERHRLVLVDDVELAILDLGQRDGRDADLLRVVDVRDVDGDDVALAVVDERPERRIHARRDRAVLLQL